jgi:thioredoxin reductase (NADPH)
VFIVGDGPAGLSAGIFTSRQGLDTVITGTGGSMLRMNSHLENYPGFPDGINPRLLLDILGDQAESSGCERVDDEIDDVDHHPEGGFVLSSLSSNKFNYRTKHLIGASAGNADYLRNLDVTIVDQEHGAYVESDESGRTSLDNLYVAGGLANKPLQAIIAAGHGAEVALAVLQDSDVSFAHDWTVPAGFFSDRKGEVPPGCEEITEDQRKDREQRSMETIRDYFENPHPENPPLPPGVERR